MLTYVMVGANNVPLSERFYTAVLSPLGYKKKEVPKGVEYIAQDAPGRGHHPNAVYLGKPFDGKEATVGNGSMLAFQAETHEMVRYVHAAGLEAGGSDEGAPGFRSEYSAHFYVGYLRDPTGSKIAIFCANPAEEGRSG